MALTKLTSNLNVIQGLSDKPTETATELKQKFDEAGNTIKTYINGTLTSELDSKISALENKDTTIEGNITSLTTQVGNIANLIYPVGSIYMSVNEVTPSTLFGGTWERIKDKFLLAVGDDYELGETGGEKEHTLTTNEMPNHKHSPTLYGTTPQGGSVTGTATTGGTGAVNFWANTNSTGGGQAHNNMPPYLAVNIWKRVS